MRTDEISKLAYYKDSFVKKCIADNLYPTEKMIEEAMAKIDFRKSYYTVDQVNDGEKIDVDVLNKQTELLYQDICLLYKTIITLTKERTHYLRNFCETELIELEKDTDFYLEKSKQEMGSSYLGETIFFGKSPFQVVNQQDKNIIDCGSIDITNGSKLTLIAQGSDLETVRLKLSNANSTYYVSPYAINRDAFTVPGELEKFETTVKLTNKKKNPCTIPYKTSGGNKYIIFTGKDCVSVKTSEKNDYKSSNKIVCAERSMIDFYLKDSESVRIISSKKPFQSNYDFSSGSVKLQKGIHHFYLEMPEDSALEIIVESGAIYAQMTHGIVKNGDLLFTQNTPFEFFDIVEISKNKKTKYDIALEIFSQNKNSNIDTILIKEAIK